MKNLTQRMIIKLMIIFALLFIITILGAFTSKVNAATIVESEDEFFAAIKNLAIQEIKLGADITLTNENLARDYEMPITLVNRTIDLNGHTLTNAKTIGSEDGYGLWVRYNNDNKRLTIKDSKGNGKIVSNETIMFKFICKKFTESGEVQVEGSRLIIQNGIFEKTFGAKPFFTQSGSNPLATTIDDATFIKGSGSVFTDGFTFTIHNMLLKGPGSGYRDYIYLNMGDNTLADSVNVDATNIWVGSEIVNYAHPADVKLNDLFIQADDPVGINMRAIPIGLISAPSLRTRKVGYSELQFEPVLVTLAGIIPSVDGEYLKFELTGENADAFETQIHAGMLTGIDSWNNSYTFGVRPKTGLDLGSYTATLTLKYDSDKNGTFETVFGGFGSIGFSVLDHNEFQVSYNTNMGTPVATQYVVEGNKATRPSPDPTRPTWTFMNWYLNPNENTKYDDYYGFWNTVNEDIELEALWSGSFNIRTSNTSMGQLAISYPGEDLTYYTTSFISHSIWTPYNDKVKIGAKANPGYKFVKWTYNGETFSTEPEIDNLTAPVGNMVLVAVFEEDNTLSFTDIPEGSWYYDSVKYVSKRGIITGYNETTFGPFDNLKREQLVNILWRIDGKPDASELSNNFTDVPDGEWYTDAIKWANANGIVKGYGGTTLFGRGDNIIRQDLAIMLTNYAKYKGKYVAPTGTLDKFADKAKVSNYAVDALRWAAENSILSGNANDDGTRTIDPMKNARRCEAAVMLTRFCQNILNMD